MRLHWISIILLGIGCYLQTRLLSLSPLPARLMPSPSPVTTTDSIDPELAALASADELDDPYVHTVSTEEFVEAVEAANREKE